MIQHAILPSDVQAGGGLMEPPPLVFCRVSLFWKDFAFDRKPLISPQGEVYIMGCDAAGDR